MTADRARELETLRKGLKVVDLTALRRGPSISTGVIAFDFVMGGGFPEGRFCEVFGDFQSGKSLLLYLAIAQCQKSGGLAILFDAERCFDPVWATALGVNVEELLIFYPEHLEDGFDKIQTAIRNIRNSAATFKNCPVLIGYDSLAASIARDEEGEDFGTPEMARRARVISSGLRKMVNLIADYRVSLVFINQLRSKIGVMYGPNEDTTGGRAPKFYATLRVHMRKKAKITDASKNVVGMGGVLEVVKSKVGAPFRPVEFSVIFNKGIDRFEGLVGYLVSQKILNPPTGGGWYSYEDRRFRVREFPAIWESIKESVIAKHSQVQVPMPVDEAPETEVQLEE